MQRKPLCLKCVYFRQQQIDGYWYEPKSYMRIWVEPHIAYQCDLYLKAIRKLRYECKGYLSVYQTRIKTEVNGMVKIEEIPSEAERIDLKKLPKEVELIAISEKMQQATEGKTGGLNITYQLRDGRTFTQKYSKVSGAVLSRALKQLGYKSTTPLFSYWHLYELQNMRIGFPRMIPVKRLKE